MRTTRTLLSGLGMCLCLAGCAAPQYSEVPPAKSPQDFKCVQFVLEQTIDQLPTATNAAPAK